MQSQYDVNKSAGAAIAKPCGKSTQVLIVKTDRPNLDLLIDKFKSGCSCQKH